jgi:hypothetical protein
MRAAWPPFCGRVCWNDIRPRKLYHEFGTEYWEICDRELPVHEERLTRLLALPLCREIEDAPEARKLLIFATNRKSRALGCPPHLRAREAPDHAARQDTPALTLIHFAPECSEDFAHYNFIRSQTFVLQQRKSSWRWGLPISTSHLAETPPTRRRKFAAREPGDGKLKVLGNARGKYVRVKA